VFGCDYADNTAFFHRHNLVIFNKKKQNIGTMKVVSAISRDSMKESSNLPIAIEKIGKLYVPDDKYFSTDPLPDVWMEIFDTEYTLSDGKDQLFDTSEELEAAYDPKLDLEHVKQTPYGTSVVMHLKV
jgi:hypothetical protein